MNSNNHKLSKLVSVIPIKYVINPPKNFFCINIQYKKKIKLNKIIPNYPDKIPPKFNVDINKAYIVPYLYKIFNIYILIYSFIL